MRRLQRHSLWNWNDIWCLGRRGHRFDQGLFENDWGRSDCHRHKNRVVEHEGSFRSALPKSREKHQEQAELSQQEHRPNVWLRQGVHSGASGKDNGSEPDHREKNEGQVKTEEVAAEGAPRGLERAANLSLGLALLAGIDRELKQAKLDGVDLNQIEVDAEDGCDEPDENKTGEVDQEGWTSDDGLVDVIGPQALECFQACKDGK